MIRLLLTALFWTGLVRAEDFPLRDAVECQPRSGAPNFVSKLSAGDAVKIAYLGGSITAAGGWRVQSRKWFQKQYPEATIDEIHAAIGGTGSDLGVFRLQNDVLRHRPDLLFVEFAVNDGGAPPERIQKAMEGIVRQTWLADPATDICFVYTVSERLMPDVRNGKMQRSASAMETVADHYKIPTIHFGVEIAELEKNGELVFTAPKPENAATAKPIVFSTDSVHPHIETGHRLYTEAIARSWPAIRDVGGKPEPHAVGKPLRADNWEAAKQVAITAGILKGDWQKLPTDHRLAKRFSRNLPALHQAKSPGAALEFSFNGISASVFDIVGPDGGALEIRLDDKPPGSRKRIDGYCTYHRMSKFPIASEIGSGIHRVTITLTNEQLDKRNILFEKNRAKYDANSENYQPHTWYAGSLLIIGEIVE